MGSPSKKRGSVPRRPSQFTGEEIAQEIQARQRYAGADAERGTYLDAEAIDRYRIQFLKGITRQEKLAKVLGKWAHENFEVLFDAGFRNFKKEVNIYLPDYHRAEEPLRVDRVRKFDSGDIIIELKPDSPRAIAKGQRKIRRVYKPLYEEQTRRPVEQARVVSYSRKDLLLIAIATGYIDPTDPGIPRSWKQELLKVFQRAHRTGESPFTHLGFRLTSASKKTPPGSDGGGGASPTSRVLVRDPRTGVVKRDLRRTGAESERARRAAAATKDARSHADALAALGRGRSLAGSTARGSAVRTTSAGIELAIGGLALLQKETVARALNRKRAIIREERLRGKWVAAFVTLEVPEVRSPLQGANPVPDFFVRDVALQTGSTKDEAVKPLEEEPRFNLPGTAAGTGPAPREGYRLEMVLYGWAAPLRRAQEAKLHGRYRIAGTDDAARAANRLVLAREMNVLSGNLDAFSLEFSSLHATYRQMQNGLSIAPGLVGRIQHECAFMATPFRRHYTIRSELRAIEIDGGATIIIEESFVGGSTPRSMGVDSGSVLWKRVKEQ